MNDRILVVDDEPGMVRLIGLYLADAGYAVVTAVTGAAAIDRVRRNEADLVVLDLGLPDIDGFSVCRAVRAAGDTPIIMLTARGEPRDRLEGFNLGADDYVSKPFVPEELVARVSAVLRRSRKLSSSPQRLILGGLEVDTTERTAMIDGASIELRPKEFDLLVKLASNPQTVFTRNQLLWQVWGYESLGDTATVDVHIGRLRKKLARTGQHAWIRTVWGVGYRFNPYSHGA